MNFFQTIPKTSTAAPTATSYKTHEKGRSHGFFATIKRSFNDIGKALSKIMHTFKSESNTLTHKESRLLKKINNVNASHETKIKLEEELKKVQASIKKLNMTYHESQSVGKKIGDLNSNVNHIIKHINEKEGKIDLSIKNELDRIKNKLNALEKDTFSQMKKNPDLPKEWMKVNENLKKAELTIIKHELLLEKHELTESLKKITREQDRQNLHDRIDYINQQLGIVESQLQPLFNHYISKLKERSQLNQAISEEKDLNARNTLISHRNILDKEIEALANKWNSLYKPGELKREKIKPAPVGIIPPSSPLDVKHPAPSHPVAKPSAPKEPLEFPIDAPRDQDIIEPPVIPSGGKIPPPPKFEKKEVLRFDGEPKVQPDEKLKKIATHLDKDRDRAQIEAEMKEIQTYLDVMNKILDPIRKDIQDYQAIKKEHDEVAKVVVDDTIATLAARKSALNSLKNHVKDGVVILEWRMKNGVKKIPYYTDHAFQDVNKDAKKPLDPQFKISNAIKVLEPLINKLEADLKKEQVKVNDLQSKLKAYESKKNNGIEFKNWKMELEKKERMLHGWKMALENRQKFLTGKKIGIQPKEQIKAVDDKFLQLHPEQTDLRQLPAHLQAGLAKGNVIEQLHGRG